MAQTFPHFSLALLPFDSESLFSVRSEPFPKHLLRPVEGSVLGTVHAFDTLRANGKKELRANGDDDLPE